MSKSFDRTKWLDFERPVIELEAKIRDLEQTAQLSHQPEIRRLRRRAEQLGEEVFSGLSIWQKVQLSRHPERPYTLDYIARIVDGGLGGFEELRGDRLFADDSSIVGGLALVRGQSMMVIGHQKGRGTKENVKRNFGMPRPEGYRKARRLMELAGRMALPIVTLVDTPGAYPGLDAEQRGQAEAIAQSLEAMAALPVPIVCIVIGEGGSGGALALSVADSLLMLEYATYSVISPEGCAAILWKGPTFAPEAAEQMKITADQLHAGGIIDRVITEPPGGAHRNFDLAAERVLDAIVTELGQLKKISSKDLIERRYQKFRAMGVM